MNDIVERLNDSLSAGYSELRKEAAEEIMRLRAKIEQMERQEPVATVIKEGDSRYWMSERLWTFPDGKYPLYALPGAAPSEHDMPSPASRDRR